MAFECYRLEIKLLLWFLFVAVKVNLPGLGGRLGASFSLLVVLLTKSSLELFKLAPLRELLLFDMPLLVLIRFVSTGDAL